MDPNRIWLHLRIQPNMLNTVLKVLCTLLFLKLSFYICLNLDCFIRPRWKSFFLARKVYKMENEMIFYKLSFFITSHVSWYLICCYQISTWLESEHFWTKTAVKHFLHIKNQTCENFGNSSKEFAWTLHWCCLNFFKVNMLIYAEKEENK